MSLINEMLKDLEQRRADGVASPDSPLKGVSRYSAAPSRSTQFTLLLTGIVLLLVALVAVLGWQYWLKDMFMGQEQNHVASMPSASKSSPPVNAPPAQASPLVASTPKTEKPAATQQKEVSQAVKASSPKKKVVASKPKLNDDTELVGDAEQGMKKQRRPLSAEQQAEVAYQKGYDFLTRSQTERGERELRRALQQLPEHIRAREMLAGIYIKAGRFVEAGELLRRGIELQPQHIVFSKLYARVLLEQNNLAMAVRVLEQRPPALQQDADYYAFLAALYQRQDNHLKAASIYSDILKLQPSMGVWWIGLAISLEKLGKAEEARSAYQRARASGTLAANLMKYTDNRLAALEDIGYPSE